MKRALLRTTCLGLMICGHTAAEAATDGVEIVVTAERRSQSVQKVAGAITALDSDKLQDRAITSIADVARTVPGLNFSDTNGTPRLIVRGVGMQVLTGVAEANIAQHIDGIYQSQPTMPGLESVDLERIEVLRGPQGTLYGRNATGGAVNFISKKPTNIFEGGVTAGIGSWKGRNVDGFLSGPIVSDVLAGRVSAYFDRDEGYYRNIVTGENLMGSRRYGVRGALRLTPATDVSVDLSAYYKKDRFTGPIQTLLRGENDLVALLENAGVIAPGSVISTTRPNETAGEYSPFDAKKTWGATLDVSVDASDTVKIRSLTGYIKHRWGPGAYDTDGTSLAIATTGSVDNPRDYKSHAFSQEFNFSGSAFDDRLSWIAGLYYFSGKLDAATDLSFVDPLIQELNGAGFGPGVKLTRLILSMREKTTSYAAFTDLTYSLTDRLRLNLGGRYSHDEKVSVQRTGVAISSNGVASEILTCPSPRTEQTFERVNGKARLEYDLAPRVLSYAQWQTGFKDGGVNITACGDTFKPESLTSLEGGIKSTLFNGVVTANLSVFHYDYTNLQVLLFTSSVLAAVDNIRKSETVGGELELTWPSRPEAAILAMLKNKD
ncbi:TonB-dependent receptor [Sphingobium sp. HBC34]|uniref:TonB-dependent receptor n=1 Tax=Sphingobium cyanobacteriorum TaxID=3063954 RepID=A0ABT8ZN92_9SPHN|nr:TonB-dependent receptor [Sphingobium sp. HBC34]MDO7835449.1 TonB-dependent receptor [Sphingobium sp. HBC34]